MVNSLFILNKNKRRREDKILHAYIELKGYASKKRSASSAAIQPVPADVIAWR